MALIGSITNYGSLQGEVNGYGNSLTGEITDEVTLDGEIVGMRGLKGDKGDPGDTGATGADGQDGVDGYSPSASVSKVGHTATITITDKDGTTTAEVYDGDDGNVFIAELGVTTYQEVVDAADDGAIVLLHVDNISIGDKQYYRLVQIYSHRCVFVWQHGAEMHFYLLNDNNSWDSQTYTFASTDTATQLRNGLMDALDKQKLDGIASGAEVNVQSDWSEADNTKDDYIKNKPTIPTVNDATLTIQKNGTTVDSFTANASSNVTANITVHDIPSGGSSGQVLAKDSNDDYDVSWVNQSGGGGSEIVYCECTDSASTVAKTATVVTGTFSSLTTGAQVAVKFTYTNTATNPTLNVAGTGAKAIMRGGTAHVGTNANESWNAGTVVFMLYDGSVWNIVGWLNTTYTGGTGAQIITGTEALNKVWSPQQIHDGIIGLADKNVQSDWNQSDTTADDYIKNKPTGVLIKTASKQSGTITVSANAIGNGTIDMSDVKPDGYTLIGVAGFYCVASGAPPISVYISAADTASVSFRNVTSSSVNQKITVVGLYLRDAI